MFAILFHDGCQHQPNIPAYYVSLDTAAPVQVPLFPESGFEQQAIKNDSGLARVSRSNIPVPLACRESPLRRKSESAISTLLAA